MNKGIDYGLGQTNIDKATGIRYGVISIHEVTQAWADSSEGDYGEASCPNCGGEAKEYDEEKHGEYAAEHSAYCSADYACEECKIYFSSENAYPEEAIAFTYEQDGYSCSQGGDDTDIFILKSPYYTTCQYCSPCAPGAGYITNTVADGVKAYCFGHDWFEDNIAPYPVYRVEDDKEVKAARETVECRCCKGKGKRSLVELAKIRGESVKECTAKLKFNTVASDFDMENKTIKCRVCNGTGNVVEVVERTIE